eukprot:3603117-Amphidinium_carterae.1
MRSQIKILQRKMNKTIQESSEQLRQFCRANKAVITQPEGQSRIRPVCERCSATKALKTV